MLDTSSITSGSARLGGGICNSPGYGTSDAVVVLNDSSRVSHNQADDGLGGGIWNDFNFGTQAIVVLNDDSRIIENVGPGIGGRGRITLNDDSSIALNEQGA